MLFRSCRNYKFLIYDNSDKLRSLYLPLDLFRKNGWYIINLEDITKEKIGKNICDYIVDKFDIYPTLIFYWINNNYNHPTEKYYYPYDVTLLYYVIDLHKSSFSTNPNIFNSVDHFVTPYAYCFNDIIKNNTPATNTAPKACCGVYPIPAQTPKATKALIPIPGARPIGQVFP